MKQNGTSHEVIQLTSQIRVLELKMKEDLIQLKEIYRKQCDGSVFVFTGNNSRPSPEELSARYEAMDKIAFQMEEARKAFRTGQEVEADYDQARVRQQLLNDPATASGSRRSSIPGEGSSILQKELRTGEMDDEEKEAMNRWSERERKLDEELLHVSVAVDRLKPLAQEMNAAGQKQEKMISAITSRVDKATANLRGINLRLRKFIDTNRKSTFIFRIVLILVLLGLGVYIFMKAKNKKSTSR
jgi:hypothetical protein